MPDVGFERGLVHSRSARFDHVFRDPDAPSELSANAICIGVLDKLVRVEQVKARSAKFEHRTLGRSLTAGRRRPSNEHTWSLWVVGKLP